MKTRDIKQRVKINAKAEAIYKALMNSKQHSAFTGAGAKLSSKEGGKFEVYDGYAYGKNIKLVKNKKIIQSWRANDSKWPKDHFSAVTYNLKQGKGFTTIDFIQLGVPAGVAKSIAKGWCDYYWEPLKQYLEK